MKALTIKEPWASLIVNGYKGYEFSGWKTKYRGKFLIHAGMSLERDMAKRFDDYNLNYGFGEIVGEAELTDCILVTEKFMDNLKKKNPLAYGVTGHKMTYAWKLENVKKFNKRYFVKGKLSLWKFDMNNMDK